MREVRCPDPAGRKPCVWYEAEQAADLLRTPPGARLVLPILDERLLGHPCVLRTRVPLALPAEVRLEIDYRDLNGLADWLESWGRPWSLVLEGLVPQEDDDLLELRRALERGKAAGCDRVLANLVDASQRPDLRAQLQEDRAYRYRLYSLLRHLCDELGLRFALLELGNVPDAMRFNRFFASAKPCCRGFPAP